MSVSLEELVNKQSKKNSKCVISVSTFESPIGVICAGADEDVIYFVAMDFSNKFQHFLSFLSEELNCKFTIRNDNIILNKLNEELKAYFSGDLKKFTVPIKLYGTDFKKRVWQKLQEIPYGTTQTYGGVAECMDKSVGSARAVGGACNSNMHLLIVPCHRVVGSGDRGGFSLGIEKKEWLLAHEQMFFK